MSCTKSKPSGAGSSQPEARTDSRAGRTRTAAKHTSSSHQATGGTARRTPRAACVALGPAVARGRSRTAITTHNENARSRRSAVSPGRSRPRLCPSRLGLPLSTLHAPLAADALPSPPEFPWTSWRARRCPTPQSRARPQLKKHGKPASLLPQTVGRYERAGTGTDRQWGGEQSRQRSASLDSLQQSIGWNRIRHTEQKHRASTQLHDSRK